MKRQEYSMIKEVAFWTMIVIVIALSVYMYKFVKSESYKCMTSPLTYGVSTLKSSNNNPVTCYCSFIGSRTTITINSSTVTEFVTG